MEHIMNHLTLIVSFFLALLCPLHSFGNVKEEAISYFKSGCEHGSKEDFAAALDCFVKSLELADKIDNHKLRLDNLWRIGNIYLRYGDYARSCKYYVQGYNDSRSYDMPDMQFLFATNAVATYALLDNIEEAKKYFALQDDIPVNDTILKHFYHLYNTGILAQAQKDVSEAIYYHLKTLDYALSHHMESMYTLTQYAELCDIYLFDKKPDMAIHYAEILADSAKNLGDTDLLSDAYGSMASAYFMKNDSISARKYKEMQLLITDSIYNAHAFNLVKSNLLDYEKKNIDDKLSFLKQRITMQSVMLIVAAVVVLLSVMFSIFIYRSRQRLRTAHGLLVDKIKELNRTNNQTYAQILCNNPHNMEEETSMSDMDTNHEESNETTGNGDVDSHKLSKEQIESICRKIDLVMNDVRVISDSNFSITQLATMINTNSAYVSNVINNVYGKNFKTLLNEHRINEACRRMADEKDYGNVTIQAIYEGLGYRSASNFIKAFRGVTSMTPSEYLKLIRNGKK